MKELSAEMLHPLGGQSCIVVYTRLGPFGIEHALAVVSRNNCHMAAEMVTILRLTTIQLPPVAALGQSCV